MGTIQQRFEVEQPVAAVFEALIEADTIMKGLPGVLAVTRTTDGHHRVTVGPVSTPQDIDVHITRNDALRRIEWRTGDAAWSGAITLEPLGPARTAVGVHAESATTDAVSPLPSTEHDLLQAFKRALQSQRVRIAYGPGDTTGARGAASGARRYASDWRETARSAFARSSDPFGVLRSVSQQMDRIWEQVLRANPIVRLPNVVPGFGWHPSVEICERDDQVRVCIDVPGVDESNLQVEIHSGYLTVRGERQDDRGNDGGRRRSELHYGSFDRRIPLPDGVDADLAKAILRNGVLEVRIPLHRPEVRRVPVQHAS